MVNTEAPAVLIHLTDAFETLKSILHDRRLLACNPFGAAHNIPDVLHGQRVACFSEMSALDDLPKLAQRRGRFGLGFFRSWMQERGAAPVWYLPKYAPIQTAFFEAVRALGFGPDRDLDHFLWQFTPFIDYPKESADGGTPYDWRWEQEWRTRGDLAFEPDNVSVLFAPENAHGMILEWWKSSVIEGWGGYFPPVVDALWPTGRQAEAIRQGPAVVEIAVPMPLDQWDEVINTAPDLSPEVDDLDAFGEERRAELRGWLEDMERDDI